MLRDLIDSKVTKDARPYHLMSVEEFEDFVTVASAIGVEALFSEKNSTTVLQEQDFRTFIGDVGRRKGLDSANREVKGIQDAFFAKLGIPQDPHHLGD